MASPIPPILATMIAALIPGNAGGEPPRAQFAQFVVQQRVVVRVPRMARVAPVVWIEKRGPKCVPLDGLAGALVIRPEAIDLVYADGARTRARLSNHCPALAFYSGMYIRPTTDGQVCAGRDSVRSRSGGACVIDKFHKLVAKR